MQDLLEGTSVLGDASLGTEPSEIEGYLGQRQQLEYRYTFSSYSSDKCSEEWRQI